MEDGSSVVVAVASGGGHDGGLASSDSYHTYTCPRSEQSSRNGDNHLCLTAGQEQTGDSHLHDVASEVTTEAGNRIQDPYLPRSERDRITTHRLPWTEPTATIRIRLQTESALQNILPTKSVCDMCKAHKISKQFTCLYLILSKATLSVCLHSTRLLWLAGRPQEDGQVRETNLPQHTGRLERMIRLQAGRQGTQPSWKQHRTVKLLHANRRFGGRALDSLTMASRPGNVRRSCMRKSGDRATPMLLLTGTCKAG